MNEKQLVGKILSQYRLNPFGTHGVSHWARVLEIGLCLAEQNGADRAVVTYFSLFHDSRRKNEGLDFNHGLRGANLARRLRHHLMDLDDARFALLLTACTDHTKGKTKGDITVRTCWDADRLDLGRVGKIPVPERLCTDEARKPDMIRWATERASRRMIPERVWNVWELTSLRFNERGLPWLDADMVDRILERATLGFISKEALRPCEDKQIRHFLKTLTTMQHYNYRYRSEAFMELHPAFAHLIPDTAHTDIVRMWLALILALKDLYHMRRSTLATILSRSPYTQKTGNNQGDFP